MCEFCTKHGDGKRWYLQAENYSEDLIHDAKRRHIIRDYAGPIVSEEALKRFCRRLKRLKQLSALPSLFKYLPVKLVNHKLKKEHYGQVVPVEGIGKIFQFVNTIVLLPCICRRTHDSRRDHYYCMGVSMKPDLGLFGETLKKQYAEGPDIEDFERLTPQKALSLLKGWEKEGVLHTVWTFGTPFIGGVCNCDRRDCAAMSATLSHGVKTMFRGEETAQTDWDRCSGCRNCMSVCQFGAIHYSAAQKKVSIDQSMCYGCGVCRSVCPSNAVRLVDRRSVPEAASRW